MENIESVNKFGKFWIDDNGIFNFKYHPGSVIDLEDAKIIVKEKNKLYNGKRYCIIVDFTGLKHLSPEASQYFSKQEGAPLVTAAAFIANAFLSKQSVTTFLEVYNYPCPIKMFTNRDEATEWLLRYKQA